MTSLLERWRKRQLSGMRPRANSRVRRSQPRRAQHCRRRWPSPRLSSGRCRRRRSQTQRQAWGRAPRRGRALALRPRLHLSQRRHHQRRGNRRRRSPRRPLDIPGTVKQRHHRPRGPTRSRRLSRPGRRIRPRARPGLPAVATAGSTDFAFLASDGADARPRRRGPSTDRHRRNRLHGSPRCPAECASCCTRSSASCIIR
jgi:hypothetical protein